MSERTALRTITDALEYVAKTANTKCAIVIIVDQDDNIDIKWSAGRKHDFIGALEIAKTVFTQSKVNEEKHAVPSGDATLN